MHVTIFIYLPLLNCHTLFTCVFFFSLCSHRWCHIFCAGLLLLSMTCNFLSFGFVCLLSCTLRRSFVQRCRNYFDSIQWCHLPQRPFAHLARFLIHFVTRFFCSFSFNIYFFFLFCFSHFCCFFIALTFFASLFICFHFSCRLFVCRFCLQCRLSCRDRIKCHANVCSSCKFHGFSFALSQSFSFCVTTCWHFLSVSHSLSHSFRLPMTFFLFLFLTLFTAIVFLSHHLVVATATC